MDLKIGWAQTDITPDRPLVMEGQMYQRYSRYIHDPITATALALCRGEEQAVLVSLDVTEPPDHCLALLRQRLEDFGQGLCFEKISFNATHTHTSSSFYADNMRQANEQVYDKNILPPAQPPDDALCGPEAQAFLVDALYDLITRAWAALAPGGVSFGHDYAAVAFNRRPRFGAADAVSTKMYGDCSRPDFLGFEYGADTAVEMLYTWNERCELTGVAVNVPCPSQVYELHSFISADYWAPTRSYIREKLGAGVYVLPLCGAAGDLAPVDLIHISRDNREELKVWSGQAKEVFRNFDMTLLCQSIGERITEAVTRGYRQAKNYINFRPIFRHEVVEMALPLRQVTESEYHDALAEAEAIHRQFSAEHPMSMEDLTRAFEPQGVIIRHRQQAQLGEYRFTSHILRLGHAALATNPFELFCEFAQRMKARAPSGQLFVVQLSNGSGGYLPTRQAVEGGSYSSKPASTCCGPEAGDLLVERTLEVLSRLWADVP